MSHKKNPADLEIYLFVNVAVEIIEKILKNFNICRCETEFDSRFISLIAK